MRSKGDSRVREVAFGILKAMPRVRLLVRRAYWAWQARRYGRLAKSAPTDEHLVFFEAYGGRSFACSPKELYAEMLEDARFADNRFVWSFREGCVPEGFPESARTKVVERGTAAYFESLARSHVWVTNTRVPEYVNPKSDQIYVQCWHGTPLKRLGYDVPVEAGGALNTSRELAERFGVDGGKWSYLISPCSYTSERLASAFGLPDDRRSRVIIEEGYPRNDALVRLGGDDAFRLGVRRSLGIPDGVKVMLYAPTWRDDSFKAGVGYTMDYLLDFHRLREALEGEWVVLFRAHYYIANEFDFAAFGGFVVDVSGVGDVNDLYLAADVLLTDYSSVMFDFATLRRPVLLFAPDLERYEERVRGFYFPLSEVPAPLCRTEEELLGALNALSEYEAVYGERYNRFLAKFAPHEDGNASRRVLERVFPGTGDGA